MTAIVGVICKDGVVIGSDSAATFTAGIQRTIEQPTKKIDIILNEIISAGTGQVGLGQRFNLIAEDVWKKNKGNIPSQIVQTICTKTIDNFNSTRLVHPFSFGALVAFYHFSKFYLCEFAEGNLQPEFKNKDMWYVSMGSGQHICDPVLGFVRKIFWEDIQPNLIDGIFGTVWALEQAIELNPGGINGPIQLATISDKGETKLLNVSECLEHTQYTKEFKDYLKSFKHALTNNPKDLPKLE